MEHAAAFAVATPPGQRASRPPRGRHRRAATSLELRLRLVRAIAATVYARRLTAEGLRVLLGEAEGGTGSIRRELAHIRSHRAEPFGVERLQVLVEVLGLDLFAILAGQATDTRLAS